MRITGDLDQIRNRWMNGRLDVLKRAWTSSVSGTGTVTGYSGDRNRFAIGGTTSKTITSSSYAVSGFPNYFAKLTSTASVSIASGDWVEPMTQAFEGAYVWDMEGSKATAGFWLETNFSGTLPLTLQLFNGTNYMTYTTTFDVVSGLQFISKVIDTLPDGYLAYASGFRMYAYIGTSAGSDYHATDLELNTWNSSVSAISHASCTQWHTTASNYVAFGEIQLRKGEHTAESMKIYNYSHGSLIGEEMACLRYYQSNYFSIRAAPSSSTLKTTAYYQTPMRAIPSIDTTSTYGILNVESSLKTSVTIVAITNYGATYGTLLCDADW